MREYLQDLFRLPSGVKRFIATESLLGIGIGIFSLLLNLHLLDRGVQEGDIGAINAVAALLTGLASIPAGFAMRWIGRKRALVIGLWLMAAGYALYGAADQLYLFYAAQCVVSCGVTLLITSEIQLLFHYCSNEKEEPRAYGGLFASFTLFTGIGTLLGGWLPDALPNALPVTLSWDGSRYEGSLYVAAFILALAGVLRALLLPPEGETAETGKVTVTVKDVPEKNAAKSRTVRQLAVLTGFLFLSGLLFGFVVPFLNVIVKLRFNLSDEPLSIIFAVYGAALFLGSLLMPYVLERLGIKKTFGMLYTAEMILLVIIASPLPVAAFILPFVLRGGTYTMLNHVADSQTMSAISDHQRNLFAGIRSVSRNLGVSLASFVTGYILAAKHYGWPFLLAAAALLLHAAYFYLLARHEIEPKSTGSEL